MVETFPTADRGRWRVRIVCRHRGRLEARSTLLAEFGAAAGALDDPARTFLAMELDGGDGRSVHGLPINWSRACPRCRYSLSINRDKLDLAARIEVLSLPVGAAWRIDAQRIGWLAARSLDELTNAVIDCR